MPSNPEHHRMPLSEQDFADEKDNALFRAIKVKDWDQVRELVSGTTALDETNDKMLQELDCHDNTALHAALGYQAPDEIVLTLLKGYPEATKIHGANDWLPLHVAAMWGSSSVVMADLIRTYPQGLDDPGQGGIKGRTPRHFKDRFAHNKELLERSTEDWISSVEQQDVIACDP